MLVVFIVAFEDVLWIYFENLQESLTFGDYIHLLSTNLNKMENIPNMVTYKIILVPTETRYFIPKPLTQE